MSRVGILERNRVNNIDRKSWPLCAKTGGYYCRNPHSDIALMFPLLEISGYERTFANLVPIYFYRLHENNDYYINRQLQYDIEMEIRKKTPLKPAISFN